MISKKILVEALLKKGSNKLIVINFQSPARLNQTSEIRDRNIEDSRKEDKMVSIIRFSGN